MYPANNNRVSRRAILVAAASTVVEWYDLTLYLYCATIISRTFFQSSPDGTDTGAIVSALAVFSLSYVMRPVGAAFFGHIGDRWGRKPVLLASMTLMGAAMLITAILPTYAQIGVGATVGITIMRFLMAFSVGGEYNSVVTYLIEGAHPHRRGFIASIAAAASEIGGVVAAAVSAITIHFTTRQQLDTWGWRIPFFVGAILAFGTLLARSSIPESPEFTDSTTEDSPLRWPILTTLRTQYRAVLRTFAISSVASVTYYVGITYIPTYLVTLNIASERASLWSSTFAAIIVVSVTPVMGMLSDRLGRRPLLLIAGCAATLLPLPFFWLIAHKGSQSLILLLFSLGMLAVIAGTYSAVSGTATAEQLPTRERLSGLALGVTMGTTVCGGLTPLISEQLVRTTGWPLAPGLVMAAVAVCVLPVTIALKETAPRVVDRAHEPSC